MPVFVIDSFSLTLRKLGAKSLNACDKTCFHVLFKNALLGVKPSLGIWTPEAICLMKKIVQNKMITVRVADKLENSSLVELTDRSVTPHISVTQVLIDAGFAEGDKGVVPDKPSDLKEASGGK